MEPNPRFRQRCLSLATVGALAIATAMTTAASLPAQAASRTAPSGACRGVSHVVHLHGKVFHVKTFGRFGIVPMRGHHMSLNQPATRCRSAQPAVSGALTYGGGAVATNP